MAILSATTWIQAQEGFKPVKSLQLNAEAVADLMKYKFDAFKVTKQGNVEISNGYQLVQESATKHYWIAKMGTNAKSFRIAGKGKPYAVRMGLKFYCVAPPSCQTGCRAAPIGENKKGEIIYVGCMGCDGECIDFIEIPLKPVARR